MVRAVDEQDAGGNPQAEGEEGPGAVEGAGAAGELGQFDDVLDGGLAGCGGAVAGLEDGGAGVVG